MSNPLDSYIETLRNAEPRAESVDRTIDALRRPRPPRLVPLAVGVAALSAVALWPRPGNGLAWAQIAAQGLPLRYHETVAEIVNGARHVYLETWVDRSLNAYRSGGVNASGTAGSYAIISPKGIYQWINGLATFSRRPKGARSFDPRSEEEFRERIDVYKALREPGIRQIGVDRNVETRVGKADRYRLEGTPGTRHASLQRALVYVRPGTSRILGYDASFPGDETQTTYEYPDRFPPDTFATPPKGGVRPYDLDAINALVRKRLRAPIATLQAGGRTSSLRLVAQGARKELYVLWSGVKPNGDLAQRVKVLGVKNQEAFGLTAFTVKGGPHTTFGGHAVQLVQRVERVDLRVPVFAPGQTRSRCVGYATARNVPVIHIYDLRSTFPAWATSSP